jgi:hypothetical protein
VNGRKDKAAAVVAGGVASPDRRVPADPLVDLPRLRRGDAKLPAHRSRRGTAPGVFASRPPGCPTSRNPCCCDSRHSSIVGGLCDRGCVEIAAGLIERIPPGNLRVRRADFAAIWVEAERVLDQNTRSGVSDWYIAGVAVTCRWLANAVVPGLQGRTPAWAPITHRTATAHEELIEAETLAAERWAARHPDGMQGRPGWLEAILTTLTWSWRGVGVPPLEIRSADAG